MEGYLAGNARLCFDQPGAVAEEKFKLETILLEQAYQRMQPTFSKRPERQITFNKNKQRFQQKMLRSVEVKSGKIQYAHVKDVLKVDKVRPVYCVTTAGGSSVLATEDQNFLVFGNNWLTLTDICPNLSPEACFANRNVGYSLVRIGPDDSGATLVPKGDLIRAVTYAGEHEVYSLKVTEPKNFVVDHLVLR